MTKVEAKGTALGEYKSDDFAVINDKYIRFSAVKKYYVTLPETADLHSNILFCGILDVVGAFQLCWSSEIAVSKISDVELQTQIFTGDSK